MRRLGLVLVVLAVLVAGCGGATKTSTNKPKVVSTQSTTPESSNSEAPAPQGKVGETVNAGDVELKIIKWEVIDGLTDWDPDTAGDKVFRAEVEFKNITNKRVQVSGGNLAVKTPEGYRYELWTSYDYPELRPYLEQADIDPNEISRGYAAVEVPANIKPSEIVFEDSEGGKARIQLQ